MTPLLIEIEPFDLKTSARRLIRIADGLETDVFGLGELVWKPCLATRPSLTQELMSLDLGGRVQAGKARFEIHTALLDQSYLHNLKWTGAPVRIYRADNLAWPTPIEFEGTVSSRTIDLPNNIVGIEAEVATTFIEKPLLTLEFDGGGGINGEAETRGVLRPAGFGSCENIEPVWFDTVRWIGQIDGYGNTTGITKLMEGLNDFGPSVADYATYTALANAIDADAVPPGRWATCIAAGIVGLGAPPEGVIGVNATFGSNRIGAMIQRILTTHGSLAAGSIDSAAFNALDAAVAYNVHYWTKDQREIKDLIEALAASAIATPIVTFNKTISITRAVTSAAVATLDRSGSITPRVVDWKVGSAVSPVWSMKARAAMPANVLSHDQVNYADTLIDRGLFSMATVYRQGNIAWDTNKASWLYIGDMAAAGNALPVWPISQNAYWQNMTPPIDLDVIGAASILDVEAAFALAKSRGRLFFQATAPLPAESNVGDTWVDSAGVFYDRVGGGIILGNKVVVLGGFRPALYWTPATVQALSATIATAAEAYDRANEAIDQLIGLADDGVLSANEKITKLVPESARLEAKWAVLSAQAATLGVSTVTAAAKRTAWTSMLAAIAPAWNDTSIESPVSRASYNAARDEYDAALYALDQAIKAAVKVLADAAATTATWSGVSGEGRPEDGADVTANAVPYLEPSSRTINVPANYLGVVDAANLPIGFSVARFRGDVNVTATSAVSIVDKSPSDGGTVTVTAGGSVSLTGLTTKSFSFKVRFVRDGVSLDALISVNRVDAAPPSTGSGSGSSGTTVFDTSFAPFSDASAVAVSDLMTVKTGASGQIAFAADLAISTGASSPNGSWNAALQWRYRTGGGSWTNLSEAASTTPVTCYYDADAVGYTVEAGQAVSSPTVTGLAANTDYEVQLLARRLGGTTRTLILSGNAVAAGT